MSRSAILRGRTFSKFRLLDKMEQWENSRCVNDGANSRGDSPRPFSYAVQKEIAEFERRETEFSKMLRKERAAELQLPGIRDNSAEFGGARNRTVRN